MLRKIKNIDAVKMYVHKCVYVCELPNLNIQNLVSQKLGLRIGMSRNLELLFLFA